jgi:hypothetical protein
MNIFMLIGLVSLVFGVVSADMLVPRERVNIKRIGKSRTHWCCDVPMLDTDCIDDDCDCHNNWCYDWKYDDDLK